MEQDALRVWWESVDAGTRRWAEALEPGEPLPARLAQTLLAAGVELHLALFVQHGRTVRRYAQPLPLRALAAPDVTAA